MPEVASSPTVDSRQLDTLSQRLVAQFESAGYCSVSPAIIQPADVFLDVVGETLRARTYVFHDPDGAELCLRPDLTVPTCRLHLVRSADITAPARYCYNGMAFRFQPQGGNPLRPRELRQVGVERFADDDLEAAEAETIATLMQAVRSEGLSNVSLEIGDLGLFHAVLEACNLPARWQKRLGETFAKPDVFASELQRLRHDPGERARQLDPDLVACVTAGDADASEQALVAYFNRRQIDWVGTRSLSELAEHLADLVADRDARPLDAGAADMIETYARLKLPIADVSPRVSELLSSYRGGEVLALDAFNRRLARLQEAGIDVAATTFSAEYGRNLAYYTGLVFEISTAALGARIPVAGGGRYDSLMRAAGAGFDVGAVGGAIHADRLLAALGGRIA